MRLPGYDIVYSDAICRSVKGTSWLQLQGRNSEYHTSTLKLASTRSYETSVHFYDIAGDKRDQLWSWSAAAKHNMRWTLSCSTLIHILHTQRLQTYGPLVASCKDARTKGHYLFICDTTSCLAHTVVHGVSEWYKWAVCCGLHMGRQCIPYVR